MFKRKFTGLAICVAMSPMFYPQISSAGIFKSGEVLEWPRDSQSFYYRTSVAMAGLIAARNSKDHSNCVDQWYFLDTKKADEAITEMMRETPDYHPQAVILAMLQKACGSFTY